MKTTFWILALFISSLFIGVIFYDNSLPLLVFEYQLIKNLFIADNKTTDILKPIILIISHLSILLLLLTKNKRLLANSLVILPVLLMISYITNMFIIIIMAPVYILSLLPFVLFWILSLIYANRPSIAMNK